MSEPKGPPQDSVHDVLAAEEFGVPAPDPVLRHQPVTLPGDPTGIAEAHDVLAAEEFAIPAYRGAHEPGAGGGARSPRARYAAVGAVAFVVDVGLFNLVLHATEKPLTSKTISTVAATTVAYVGNRYWTFRRRSRQGLGREYTLFFLLNGVGLAISLGVLAISHYLLGFTSHLADNIAANVIGLGLGTAFRFWSYRRFVFPALLPEAAAPGTVEQVGSVSGDPLPPR